MEKLIVKKFGPIASADIDIRQFTLLVGHVSSGKSTIAKLLSIFYSIGIYRIQSGDYKSFFKLLEEHNIDFPLKNDTEIKYANNHYEWHITADNFHTSFGYADLVNKGLYGSLNFRNNMIELSSKYSDLREILGEEIWTDIELATLDTTDDKSDSKLWSRSYSMIKNKLHIGYSVYIPAERNIFSILRNNIFSFLDKNISIPKNLLEFGRLYEGANNRNKQISIPFLKNINVTFFGEDTGNQSDTYISLEDGEKIPLRQASSGFQSLIPLFSVLQFWGGYGTNNVLIEEPEANLFPTVQKNLVEYIVKTTGRGQKSNCIITSHSPYILSSFDALVQAGNASEKNPEETAKIVPAEQWIKYDNISCYYFDEKGNVFNAKNDELKNIGSEVIDTVSDTINDEYDKLLNIIHS